MSYREDRLAEFVELLERHAPQDGVNQTVLADVGTFRGSEQHARIPEAYEPAILMMGQGRKICYLGGREFDYSVGDYLAVFLPMPLEAKVVEASPEKPMPVLGIRVDLQRIASMLLKMDRLEGSIVRPEAADPSGIFSAPLHNDLLDPAIRLLRALVLEPVSTTRRSGRSILKRHVRRS